ncbi:MAG TPA: hypothetical protein VGP78_02235 [Solirubrobacteraceae bacterium]|jgi:hypothetical protein|nr:hypothetical protein [Solirubrobacteraceae bacterium]
MSATAHLRIYRFESDTVFEGAVVGAVEQLEAGTCLTLLDALFVGRDAAAGELQAIDLATARADGTLAGMLDFRLDLGRRREMTRRTLATAAGVPPDVIAAMVGGLEPGAALLVVLLSGGAPTSLDDAVARTGGRVMADEVVSASTLAEAAPRLSAAL